MSNTNINGGPAFPCDQIIARDANGHMQGVEVSGPGMTLREYFAGQAISQIIATCANDTTHGMTKADYFAGRAYEIADAMLKARGDTP